MFRCLFLVLACLTASLFAQSTCPVKTTFNQQRCKCGIKTDGQIYIYCARKQLTQLPEFTRSSILYEELILTGNQISHINTNDFRGLRVKRLYLDDNPIQSIEPNALTELANYLEELVISVDRTQVVYDRPQLPARLFKSLLNLKIVKLTGLQVTDIDSGYLDSSLFNRTRKLEVIHLTDCGLKSLAPYAFSGVEYSLRELNLDNNQIGSADVAFNELERMRRLEVLVLSRNKIRRLDRFSGHYATDSVGSELTMGSNLISGLQASAKSLEIDLSFNAINHIDRFAFAGQSLSATTKLNLNNNELNQFQLGFIAQLAMLTELYLDYNKISYVPDNLFINSRYLETLSLKGNFISQIGSEFAFSGLHFSLMRLNLASNKLNTIGRRVFMQTTKLRDLNLERNELGSHFEMLIKNIDQQDSIDFDPISNTPLINTFEGIESELRSLNLENNNLRPGHLWSIVNLLNVESLRLGHNSFATLALAAVKPLDKLSSLFKFYRNLTQLDIQNSSIKTLPYFIGLNKSLTSLNLGKNHLCHVNANNLRQFYADVKYLNLNANPLVCDQNIISLRQWIDETIQLKHPKQQASSNNHGQYSQDLNSVQTDPSLNWMCAYPYQVNNRRLNSLSNTELSQVVSNGQCQLDMDEFMYAQSLLVPKTTTTTTTTSTRTSIKPSTKKIEQIVTVTPSQANLLIEKLLTPGLKNAGVIKSDPSLDNTTPATSFINSPELKQTLMGSLIGAFLVLSIVCGILCILKTTRAGQLKDLSLCSSSTSTTKPEKKSQHVSSTTSSSSPYEMSKLTLQTMCINSSNSSASSGSGSTNSQLTTNSDCNFFNKMDPLRLTLLNQMSASAYNPQYLTNCNLHYLASNLPYSPNESLMGAGSCTTSPTTFTSQTDTSKLNSGIVNLLNETNTYDKLHQRFNTLGQQSQQQQQAHLVSTLNSNQQNHLINKYIQNLNRQLQSSGGTMLANHHYNQNQIAESTPFLIIQNINDINRIVNGCGQETADQGCDNYQHTYHEIGEVLLNSKMNRAQNSSSFTNGNISKQVGDDQSGNSELFI